MENFGLGGRPAGPVGKHAGWQLAVRRVFPFVAYKFAVELGEFPVALAEIVEPMTQIPPWLRFGGLTGMG